MDIENTNTQIITFRRDQVLEKYRENSKKTSLRKLHLVLDFTQNMMEKDFNPNTIYVVLTRAIEFIEEFFELNPLSNVALSLAKDRKCILQTAFKNSPTELVALMEHLRKKNSVSEDKFFEELNKDSDVVSTVDIPSGIGVFI